MRSLALSAFLNLVSHLLTHSQKNTALAKRKKILFVLRKAPHHGAYAYETLDVIMTAAAFDQDVSLLLLDDAVFQLKAKQNPESVRIKNTAAMFAALAVYGIDNILVETESLQSRGLIPGELTEKVAEISRRDIGEFYKQFDVVVTD